MSLASSQLKALSYGRMRSFLLRLYRVEMNECDHLGLNSQASQASKTDQSTPGIILCQDLEQAAGPPRKVGIGEAGSRTSDEEKVI